MSNSGTHACQIAALTTYPSGPSVWNLFKYLIKVGGTKWALSILIIQLFLIQINVACCSIIEFLLLMPCWMCGEPKKNLLWDFSHTDDQSYCFFEVRRRFIFFCTFPSASIPFFAISFDLFFILLLFWIIHRVVFNSICSASLFLISFLFFTSVQNIIGATFNHWIFSMALSTTLLLIKNPAVGLGLEN